MQEIFKMPQIDNKIIMKTLCRNFQILFPVKLNDFDSDLITNKLDAIYQEFIARQGTSKVKFTDTNS